MRELRAMTASVLACAMIVAACVPDSEGEVRSYTSRYGLSNAFAKYEREAKGGDHSKSINLYIFLMLYENKMKNENVLTYNNYDKRFIL